MSDNPDDSAPFIRAFSFALYALEAHLVQEGALQPGRLAETLRLFDPLDDATSKEGASVLAHMADELDADHFGHGRRSPAIVVRPPDND